jgi:hypothetical protein
LTVEKYFAEQFLASLKNLRVSSGGNKEHANLVFQSIMIEYVDLLKNGNQVVNNAQLLVSVRGQREFEALLVT